MFLEIILGILIMWIIAEVGSSMVHFLEDTYGNPSWEHSKSWLKRKIFQEIIGPNILHHKKPSEMTKGTWWYRNRSSIIPAFILAGISYILWPNIWSVWGGFILLGFANEFHCWQHLPKNKVSWPIRKLQAIGIIQSPLHHKRHHTPNYQQNFAVMSNWMNPILTFIHFWDIMKFLIWLITGAKPLKEREIY